MTLTELQTYIRNRDCHLDLKHLYEVELEKCFHLKEALNHVKYGAQRI